MIGKVLVTGANGMLGSNFVRHFPASEVVGYGHKDLDITNAKTVAAVLQKEKPSIIIHTAALTDVERCEKSPDQAYHINALGTQNLVNFSLEHNVMFVYISSTGIYGDSKTQAYTEFDTPQPTTIYHKSKYEGEKIITNHLSHYLILRTGWLFGGDISHQKNFVYQRFKEAERAEVVYSNNEQIGNPTYIMNLVYQIKSLILNKQYGIYNCVDHAIQVSRFDYVKKVLEYFDAACEVKAVTAEHFKRVAPVAENESAVNYKLQLLGLDKMTDWEASLHKYVAKLKEKGCVYVR